MGWISFQPVADSKKVGRLAAATRLPFAVGLFQLIRKSIAIYLAAAAENLLLSIHTHSTLGWSSFLACDGGKLSTSIIVSSFFPFLFSALPLTPCRHRASCRTAAGHSKNINKLSQAEVSSISGCFEGRGRPVGGTADSSYSMDEEKKSPWRAM